MADTLTIAEIGPEHAGTRMTLEEFACVEGRPGHLYELERGVVLVMDVPDLEHGLVVQGVRNGFSAYQIAHPDRIYYIAGGSEAALRLRGMQSERHPDLAVYLTRPTLAGGQPWNHWTPDIVVEVVSESSEQRDYEIKRDEYLKAGVKLYWILDRQSRSTLVLTRRGDEWTDERLESTASLTTPMLPGFSIPLANVFGS